MAQLPSAVEQVLRVHAAFIHTVVNALRDRSQLPDLMKQLDAAEQQVPEPRPGVHAVPSAAAGPPQGG